MKTVEMFQAVDGKVFFSEKECKAHDEDCIGAEFDTLLLEAVNAANGNVTSVTKIILKTACSLRAALLFSF